MYEVCTHASRALITIASECGRRARVNYYRERTVSPPTRHSGTVTDFLLILWRTSTVTDFYCSELHWTVCWTFVTPPFVTPGVEAVVPWHVVDSTNGTWRGKHPRYLYNYLPFIFLSVVLEQLTRLQTSCRAYRSHVSRILNKVEDTLAKEIDELALTYLKTTVTQLEKKHEQICKADTQIAELIQEPRELEEAILDSEELQDLIVGNIIK